MYVYLWQHKKMNNYWIFFIVNVINDYHNNSRVVKGKVARPKKFIMKVVVIKTQISPTTYYIYGNKEKTNPHLPLL
jgi:hypothetical protein